MANPVDDTKPAEELIDETKVRAYLKDKYGIEDDPDTFKGKVAKWRQVEEEFPKYQQFAQEVIKYVNTPNDEPTRPQPKATPAVPADEIDEEELRKLARLDPFDATKRYTEYREAKLRKEFDERTRQTMQFADGRVRAEQAREQHNQWVVSEWPEARDQSSELYKTGQMIFQQEMSDLDKRRPDAFRISIERAAARQGIPPASRRKPAEATSDDIASQSVERRGSRKDVTPAGDADGWKKLKLNAREEEMVEQMGITVDEFKQNKFRYQQQAK